jgi:hypothetical protein
MSDPKLGPLPSDIARLLEAEKRRAPDSIERTDRVLERVRASLISPPPGGGGDGGDGGGGSSEPPRGDSRGPPMPLIGAKVGGALAVAVTAGAIAGAVGHARLAPVPHPEVAQCMPSAQAPSKAPVVQPQVDEIESGVALENADASLSKPNAVAVAPPPAASATGSLMPRDLDLARERSLIDMARSALARGSSAAAISALQDHNRAFPAGRLSEEREALWVQVLASSGQRAQAVRRAAAFNRQFPNSMLAPAVEAAVSTSDADALP